MANLGITIEIYDRGRWVKAAEVRFSEKVHRTAYRSDSVLSYDIDYVVPLIGHDSGYNRVGCQYEVNFADYPNNCWPAFLLDLVPTGPARDYWLKRLQLKEDDASSWYYLLKEGAGSPPGNMRIAEATQVDYPAIQHKGFEKAEIIEKNADFIEYAESCGAAVSGATDVQGQAPKYLLVRDRHGRWHADGALADSEVESHWLVKFARGKDSADHVVLRNEAPYYRVAQQFGIKTTSGLDFEDGALFIPRFDRVVTASRVERYGMESLCSAAGISEFGARLYHDKAAELFTKYSSNPKQDLREYLLRDVLNIALRNTDNHGRNTAFLMTPDGNTLLSPLFDFAPMFLDPEGISRSSRWQGNGESEIGLPDWRQVAENLHNDLNYDEEWLRKVLSDLAPQVERLPDTMYQCGVEQFVVEKLADRIDRVARGLYAAK